MGLGTLLLNETYKQMRMFFPDCTMIYLHVVDYNEAAIRFYLKKNNFIFQKREYDHYVIFDKEYDALVLYKMIDSIDEEEGEEEQP